VGQFAIMSAYLQGADRLIAVGRYQDRLKMARAQGAAAVDVASKDPVTVTRELTGGIGVDRVIDVGVDAMGKDTSANLAQYQPLTDAIQVYETFDARGRGWTKVKLEPAARPRTPG
jgi:threonine dehydrogenase-like Zn-dependent dehydrogenase